MCDLCSIKVSSWQGWMPLPETTAVSRSSQPWTDLSHAIGPNMPSMAVFDPPTIERIISLPDGPANITRFQMVVHQGTHIDAPFHLFMDGPTVDQIPLERLTGPGVVWHIPKQPFELIELADFERARPMLQPGDIVLLDTGWSLHANTPTYAQHPNLSTDAAQWLVDHRVKLLGIDFSTPDLSAQRRPAGFTWPVHQVLLGNGVLVAEHLTNLRSLTGQRIEVAFLALNIAGADGAPARVVARGLDT
jgi:arylformamidase